MWKFDTELNLISNAFSEIPRADKAYRFKQIADGGFIICGSVVPLSSPNWSPAFFYMKTDIDGTMEWYHQNESHNNCAHDLLINNTSGYYFAGKSSSRARLVKTDLEGNGMIVSINPNKNTIEGKLFKVFPNPGHNEIMITGSDMDGQLNISLFNLYGRELINTACFNNQCKVHTTNIPQGLYYYKISRNDEILQSGKWIKE